MYYWLKQLLIGTNPNPETEIKMHPVLKIILVPYFILLITTITIMFISSLGQWIVFQQMGETSLKMPLIPPSVLDYSIAIVKIYSGPASLAMFLIILDPDRLEYAVKILDVIFGAANRQLNKYKHQNDYDQEIINNHDYDQENKNLQYQE